MKENQTQKPSAVRKFYHLEYFYILLKSLEKSSDKDQIFEIFKDLKQEYRLGESKYRKLTSNSQNLSERQIQKYRYTFEKVISESLEYDLINHDGGKYQLTDKGRSLMESYNQGFQTYTRSLCVLMEEKYNAFRYIIDRLYKSSRENPGLLILPLYSPLQLGFDKSEIKTTKDIKRYAERLAKKLEQDLSTFLKESRSLNLENNKLLASLVEEELISADDSSEFSQNKYIAIIAKFRDFWRKYFLQEIYLYEYYYTSFEIWTYRAKQIGIIHSTEFYPHFNGKIVYPTSVIVRNTDSKDFKKIYTYKDGYSLYIHEPEPYIEANENLFIDYLVKAYFDLRRTNRSYFISLPALRELVCYKLKISEYVFKQFLDSVYIKNLTGNLKIKISLEVDRLPEETKAMYLKQEPVMVDGRYRNIIAIDVSGGGI